MQKVPEAVIVEAGFFISYLRGDELADRVEKLLKLEPTGQLGRGCDTRPRAIPKRAFPSRFL